MTGKPCLVVTSIAPPTPALRELSFGAAAGGFDFILVGDEASPADFLLEGCQFYGLDRQRELPFAFAAACPVRHYARKNIGYLLAMAQHATTIVETDDDTAAYPAFWGKRVRPQGSAVVTQQGWVNVYRYFSSARIWPRGFPLDEARAPVRPRHDLVARDVTSPIQQGLVDDDPDVDAIYRLILDLPFKFESGESVALGSGVWCPFNSQNTTWWPEAYPLLYLPAYCSFRMTDIWRSFIAQRISWANGWSVLFHAPTVAQVRNDHDLMRDFHDELPGYLSNRAMCAALESLDLPGGMEHVGPNLRRGYELLVEHDWLDGRELPLVDAWLSDIAAVTADEPADATLAKPRADNPANG